jgi:hypothetical protein
VVSCRRKTPSCSVDAALPSRRIRIRRRLVGVAASRADDGVFRRTRFGGAAHPTRIGIVPQVRSPGPLVLDALVWLVFIALFVGAALLVKVAAVLLVVLVVLALLLGFVLRALRKRRRAPRRPR